MLARFHEVIPDDDQLFAAAGGRVNGRLVPIEKGVLAP